MSKTLIHPRIAKNLEMMGYFPTDDATLRGIINFLAYSEEAVKILDPCCGTAAAINALSRQRYPFAERYGIELDVDRANMAKKELTGFLLGSALDTRVTPQSVDVLFLNPPYANALRDKESMDKAERLEHQFLNRFFPSLRAGGIMIYIVPKVFVNETFQKWYLSHFEDVRIYEAATDRFNQIVLVGRKVSGIISIDKKIMVNIAKWQKGDEQWPKLPDQAEDHYKVEGNPKTLNMISVEMDEAGLEELLKTQNGLWRDFDASFCRLDSSAEIRPLHDLTDWHTVLLISSGVVSGLVDNGKRTLLVKGKTTKSKVIVVREDENGQTRAEEHRDVFNTVVKGIDLTPHSPAYGQIILIK